MCFEEEYDDLEREALQDMADDIQREKSQKLREKVYEYCRDYYKRNGEPPDIDSAIEGLGLSDDADDELIDRMIYDWIKTDDFKL